MLLDWYSSICNELQICSKRDHLLVEDKLKGGYSHAQRTECVKKFVDEEPKTNLGESQFLKLINCHSIKMI